MEIETPEENQFIGGLVQSHGGTGYFLFPFFVGRGGGGMGWVVVVVVVVVVGGGVGADNCES